MRAAGDETRCYAGIGSRGTPSGVLTYMRQVGALLAERGWTLRTGGAPGADTAFEKGALLDRALPGVLELYLPWPGFELREHYVKLARPTAEAARMAADVHPVWHRLSPGARACVARNVHQVLGPDLRVRPVKSRFVLCWTSDGAESYGEVDKPTGGTGTAIRVADRHCVPVWNLQRRDPLPVRELVARLEELSL